MELYQPGVADEWIGYKTTRGDIDGLKVAGQSMEPEYREGDIVIVQKEREAKDGDDIVAEYDGETTFKRLKRVDDGLLLVPLNPRHDSIYISAKRAKRLFQVRGVVVALIRKVRR